MYLDYDKKSTIDVYSTDLANAAVLGRLRDLDEIWAVTKVDDYYDESFIFMLECLPEWDPESIKVLDVDIIAELKKFPDKPEMQRWVDENWPMPE